MIRISKLMKSFSPQSTLGSKATEIDGMAMTPRCTKLSWLSMRYPPPICQKVTILTDRSVTKHGERWSLKKDRKNLLLESWKTVKVIVLAKNLILIHMPSPTQRYHRSPSSAYRNTDPKTRTTVRSLRDREVTAKYLYNLDLNSAYYDPKSRSLRQNPFEGI